ncbi:protein phosphatase 2C-like domain-containing protein 1 [Candoia aspera]|uniref:protein phosphatase 2C-like domain-containing protein 1 n=1 Tax=Candoia aspera TaxID=51853 RepID=UPI002FD843C6
MTYQTELQNYETGTEKQDLTKVINIDFKKIESLDIRIPCSICEEMVHITQLFHHKKVHQAQAVLDYQWPWVEPINIKKMVLRRKQLILRLQKTAQYPEREIEKIGCSIDLLKESIKMAPYICIDNVAQSSVYIKEVSNPLIKAIAICQDKNAVWHTDLEDVCIVLDNYGHRKDTCLLGLFDGSNGISAAQLSSDELPLLLLDQLSHSDPSYQISDAEKNMLRSFHTIFKTDYKIREKIFAIRRVRSQNAQPNNYEWIHRACAKAFWRMDRLLRLGRGEVSKVRWSSCTTAICLVETVRNIKQNQVEQEGEEVKTINDNEEQNFMELEEELPETNRIKTRSIIEQEASKIMEQQEEKPLRRVSDGKEQNSPEQEEGSVTELHQEEPLARTNDGKEENSPEQEEGSVTEQHQEEPFARMNDGKEENSPEQEEGSVAEQHQKEPFARMNDGKEENSPEQEEGSVAEQHQEEPFARMNDGKEENSPEQEEGSVAEQHQREPLGRVSDGKEQNSPEQEEGSVTELHQEELLARMNDGKEENSPEQEANSFTGHPQEEQLRRINDGMKKSIIEPEDNEQLANSKDEIQEAGWIENNQNSDEIVGLMHIANIVLGNVHAVLCKNGKSYWLTKEHSTYCKEERARILQNGGSISSNEPKGLIEGLIKTSRGLGHHGNPKMKKTVIPVPHTISFSVDNSCQFLIIATNGLWEVLDKSEVVLLTLTLFSAYLAKYQHAQLMKSRIPKASKVSLENKFYSWYMNRDFFPESDLDNKNETEPSFQLRLPINSGTEEKVVLQSSTISTEEQTSENSSESLFTVATSSEENTSAGTEETQKENSKNAEEMVSESHEFLQTSEDSETDSGTFYSLAAKYITKHLVKAALKAGSRNNVSVLLALLNGCDNIPTFI